MNVAESLHIAVWLFYGLIFNITLDEDMIIKFVRKICDIFLINGNIKTILCVFLVQSSIAL